MDTTTAVVGTVGVVALGKWATDKKIDLKFAVGTGIYAAAISILGQSNSKFAQQFATLVFVTALLLYIVKITNALGFTKTATGGLNSLSGAINAAADAAREAARNR